MLGDDARGGSFSDTPVQVASGSQEKSDALLPQMRGTVQLWSDGRSGASVSRNHPRSSSGSLEEISEYFFETGSIRSQRCPIPEEETERED